MDPYKTIYRLFEVISVAAAAASSKLFADWLAKAGIQSPVVFVLSIIAVPIVYELVSILLKAAFNSSRLLRRILLRNHFVEGTWVEIARVDEQFLSIAIKWVDANGNSLKIHGNDYNLDGSINCDFCSAKDLLQIEWPTVRYVSNIFWHDKRGSVEGVSRMHFSSRGMRRPKSYAGRYLDIGSGAYLGFEGWLLSKQDLAKVDDPKLLPELLNEWVKAKGLAVATPAKLAPVATPAKLTS